MGENLYTEIHKWVDSDIQKWVQLKMRLQNPTAHSQFTVSQNHKWVTSEI